MFYSKNRSLFIIGVVCLVLAIAVVAFTPEVLAGYGLEETAGAAGLIKGETDLAKRIGDIIYAFLGLTGVVFLVIIIYGGFVWMTSSGSPERVKKAGEYLRNGIIGAIIILASYSIAFFVFNVLLDLDNNAGGGRGNTCTQIPDQVCSCSCGSSDSGIGSCPTEPGKCSGNPQECCIVK